MTQPDPLLGQVVLGRYRILRLLGEGGMGVVYEAEHTLIEKRIALKVLRAAYSNQEELVTRFQREAISASRIKHPNILDVFDFGQLEDGSFYLAMEYLDGHDLADELSKNGVLSPERGLKLAMQICRALAAAHARGVVHRDLKPENIFLCRCGESDESVKIVDFGIARLRGRESIPDQEHSVHRRLTKTGMIFGTPEYMSPEQARGGEADVRSDVYAVGILLFEMFSGAVPFRGDSFMTVLTSHLIDPMPSMHRGARAGDLPGPGEGPDSAHPVDG
jgi:serine/threonine protein kinase